MRNFSFTDLSDCEFFPHIVIFLISALIWFAFLFIDILKAIFKAPKKDKLIKELENNLTNVRFEILEKILNDSGFELKGVKSSHHQFSNGKLLITLPYHKPMKIFYVKLVLNAIKG